MQKVSLRPFGYETLSNVSATETAPVDGVFFLDEDHILVTGRVPGLLPRVADSLPGDDDRLVRASVVDVPSGKLVATANWRLHDHELFFWQLDGGKFVIRVRNQLFLTDATLKMRPFLHSAAPIQLIEVSADGKAIVVETSLERHTPAEHEALVKKAKALGIAAPAEDVRVLVIQPDTGTVIAESRERQPASIALVRKGFVEAVPRRSSRWDLRYVPFSGKGSDLGRFVSHCEVTVRALNEDTLLLGACLGNEGARGAIAVSMEGKTLWTVPPRHDLVLPRFSVSPDGNEVSLSRVVISTPSESWAAFVHDNDVAAQQVNVMDIRTGALRLKEFPEPSVANAHNSAFSPDGHRFTVLKSDNLEIFDIPASPRSRFHADFAENQLPARDDTPFTSYHQFRTREVPLAQAGLDLTAESADLLALAPQPLFAPDDAEVDPVATTTSVAVTDPTTMLAPLAETSSVIHVSTRLVLVDVVVTDKGKAVKGLEKTQFHIMENGREQHLTYFEESQSDEALKQQAGPVQAPNTYTNMPSSSSSGPLNVILLDSLNTPITDQAEVYRQVVQYMQHVKPGTPFAIFALNRKLQMVSGFTSDPALLTSALKSEAARPKMSIGMDNGFAASLRASGDAAASNAPPGAEGIGAQIQANAYNTAADVTAASTSTQIQITIMGLSQLGHYLSNIPGRKNLIWFSGSFPIEVFPDFSGTQPVGNTAVPIYIAKGGGGDSTMQSRNDSESGGLIQDMARLLQAARVAVYPVYALGPTQTMSMSAQYNLGDHRIVGFNDLDQQANDQQSENQATLRMLASESGGEYNNTSGFKQAIESAVRNGSHYYTIGYVPMERSADSSPRSLKVKLEPGNYKLAYRRSYFAEPAKAPSPKSPRSLAAMQLAAAPGSPPSTQIEFQTRILPATDVLFKEVHLSAAPAGDLAGKLKGPLHRYVVDLALNPHDVGFLTGADGDYSSELDCVLVAYDDDGKRINSLEQGLRLHLKPSQYNRLMTANIVHRMELDLQPGHYTFHIVVFDPTSAHTGSLDAPVTIPKS